MSTEVRHAIEEQIEGHVPQACVNCTDVPLLRSNQVLQANPDAAVGCLAEIFERGYAQAGMWRHPGAAPADVDWTLPVIGFLRPARGRALFESVAREETEPVRAAWAKANLVLLGDRAYSADIAQFLDALPTGAAQEASRARYVGQQALTALSAANYRPALGTIQRLLARSYPDKRLPVYEAQFRGDVAGVLDLARPGATASAALQALVAMNRKDTLRQVADSADHPLRLEARRILESEAGRSVGSDSRTNIE